MNKKIDKELEGLINRLICLGKEIGDIIWGLIALSREIVKNKKRTKQLSKMKS
jgi:hypothetical protein